MLLIAHFSCSQLGLGRDIIDNVRVFWQVWLEGEERAELQAIARTAKHRLDRGIWTSTGAGAHTKPFPPSSPGHHANIPPCLHVCHGSLG